MRDEEFNQTNQLERKELLALLDQLEEDLRKAITDLPPEQLTNRVVVQGFEENGIGILIHVAEHFSYHVGQMTWIVKMLTNQPTGYYEGLNLNAKSD